MHGRSLSAIDIGSNAIRLIIAEKTAESFRVVKKYRIPIRLGKDVFHRGEISGKTMKESSRAFEKIAEIHRRWNILKYSAVATSAVREAQNQNEFVSEIKRKSGIQIQVIDGVLEANYIHNAIIHELDLSQRRAVLIDVGGGSVEVTFSEHAKMLTTKSFRMGTVRLLEHLNKRNLKEKDFKIVLGDFIQPLSQYIGTFKSDHELDIAVGTGGNIECMGKLRLQLLGKSPTNYVLLSELVEIADIVGKLSIKDRVEKLHLKPDRADVIIPALLLVKTILTQTGVEKILVPGVGLRDGLLWSLVSR